MTKYKFILSFIFASLVVLLITCNERGAAGVENEEEEVLPEEVQSDELSTEEN